MRRNERLYIGKKDTDLSLFTDDINTKKPVAYLYIRNKQSENEFIKWQNGKSMEIYKENNNMLVYVF